MGQHDPDTYVQKRALSPPTLLERAGSDANRPKYGPELLQMRIEEMLRNPEETRRNNEEHAAKMGLDVDAILAKWGINPNPIMPSIIPVEVHNTVSTLECVASPHTYVSMQDATTLADSDGLRSPMGDAQMEGAPTSAGLEGSPMPGSDSSSEGTTMPVEHTSPTQGDHVEQSHMSMQQQNNARQSPESKHTTAPRGSKANATERKLKKEKARLNLAIILQKPASASESLSPMTNDIAQTPGIDNDREAAMKSTIAMDHDHTPSLFVSQTERYPVLDFAQWYKDITLSSRAMKELAKKRPQSLTALDSLKNCIARCDLQKQLVKPADRQKRLELLEELRDHVHKAEFLPEITKFLVKTARILTPENGLPRIFKEDAVFPWDLKADAYQLYARWIKGNFQQDVLRGILTVKGKDRASDRISQTYKASFPTTAKHHGDHGLVLGQCWPTQLCTVRDGAHGTPQGGIFYERGKGTYSIVLSSGGYKDEDNGDVIKYSGTEGKEYEPTVATKEMIRSHELDNVIRVIRSHQLPVHNVYRPKIGLRYDGLYKIVAYEVIDKEKQSHRFELWRCPGQEPIRCGENASRRPTKYEESEFEKVRA